MQLQLFLYNIFRTSMKNPHFMGWLTGRGLKRPEFVDIPGRRAYYETAAQQYGNQFRRNLLWKEKNHLENIF